MYTHFFDGRYGVDPFSLFLLLVAAAVLGIPFMWIDRFAGAHCAGGAARFFTQHHRPQPGAMAVRALDADHLACVRAGRPRVPAGVFVDIPHRFHVGAAYP